MHNVLGRLHADIAEAEHFVASLDGSLSVLLPQSCVSLRHRMNWCIWEFLRPYVIVKNEIRVTPEDVEQFGQVADLRTFLLSHYFTVTDASQLKSYGACLRWDPCDSGCPFCLGQPQQADPENLAFVNIRVVKSTFL
jgi:hypothetical protein